MKFKKFSFIVFCMFLTQSLVLGESNSKDTHKKFSAGIHYTGAQLRWAMSPLWALEGRYSVGEESVGEDRVRVDVIGGGVTRFLSTRDDWRLYTGGRLGWIQGDTRSGDAPSKGYAAGAVLGVEKFVGSSVSVSLDVGPYYVWMKEDAGGLTEQGVDIVADAAVYFHWGGRR